MRAGKGMYTKQCEEGLVQESEWQFAPRFSAGSIPVW